ncbi:reverse transcriptase [Hirsutella rhossiliensis]
MCNAANAEGQQLDEFPALPTTATQEQRLPIDITHAATQLIDAQAAVYNAKLRVFRTFCAHFNEAAKEFATGPERDFAKHFSTSFLGFWEQTLANTSPASTPTYSGIAANGTASPANPRPKPAATHHQAQGSPVPAPSREDLRVFVRLEADAPARNHIGYAIRAHVASKTGLELNRIPQVLQVNTGWAIRAADKATRDLLIERQAEWADDLGATAVETSQKWYNYVVDNCPRRLTDLYGNEVDYDAAVRDEVNNQTGHTPFCHRVSDTPEGRGTQARSAGETPLADIA